MKPPPHVTIDVGVHGLVDEYFPLGYNINQAVMRAVQVAFLGIKILPYPYFSQRVGLDLAYLLVDWALGVMTDYSIWIEKVL